MKFLRPIEVGDEVSCYCISEEETAASVKVRIETWARSPGETEAANVTEGVFTYVAMTENGRPRRLDDQEQG